MKHRKAMWGAGKAVLFALAFLLAFNGVSFVLRGKGAIHFLYPFDQQPKDTIDVVFAGSSHVLNAVFPMQLWQEQGITSYNIAQKAQPMPLTYFTVKDAIDRQHPNLVVLDVYYMFYGGEGAYDPKWGGYMHQTFDDLRLSINKVRGILEVIRPEDREEMFVPLMLYHSRWKDLQKEDFQPVTDYYKGAEPYFGKTPYGGFTILAEDQTMDIPAMQLEYLEKTIDLCRESGTKLLLINLPYHTDETTEYRQRLGNKVAEVATKKDVPYLNFFHMLDQVPIDFDTDMRDEGHLNPQGAAKMTAFLGQYIADHYHLADRRDDPAYVSWKDDYETYQLVKTADELKTIKDLPAYLDMLAKGDFVVAFAVRATPGEAMTPALQAKLADLGVTRNLADGTVTNYLAVLDGGSAVVEKAGVDIEKKLSATTVVDGTQFKLTSGRSEALIRVAGQSLSRNGTSLNFVVWDKLSNEVVDSVRFNCHDADYYCARK